MFHMTRATTPGHRRRGDSIVLICSSVGGDGMDYDQDKVDEMVLALLWLTQTGDGRTWKGHDWVAMAGCTPRGTSPIRRARPSQSC